MKQAIILIIEDMDDEESSCMKEIGIYIEMPGQALHFYDYLSETDNASFHTRRHRQFDKLCSMLERWEMAGIGAEIHKRFKNLEEWEAWKKEVNFSDYEERWHIFIQQDDGSWDFYLELTFAFPPALEEIYRMAESMGKS
jgi:hypothetical protein